MAAVPPLSGLLESALYVDDPHRSVAFYQKIFGFECIVDFDRLYFRDPDGHLLTTPIYPSPLPR